MSCFFVHISTFFRNCTVGLCAPPGESALPLNIRSNFYIKKKKHRAETRRRWHLWFTVVACGEAKNALSATLKTTFFSACCWAGRFRTPSKHPSLFSSEKKEHPLSPLTLLHPFISSPPPNLPHNPHKISANPTKEIIAPATARHRPPHRPAPPSGGSAWGSTRRCIPKS